MQVLGVVPARGGSKAVPRKNLRIVGGRPLFAYTVDAAHASRRLTRTIVSTDDPETGDMASALGVDVPFMRPADLAGDETPMLPVLQHAVRTMEQQGFVADAVVLLQPTSPLRRAEHIDAAIDLLDATGADSVVTVVAVPHQFTPGSVMRIEDGRLRPLADNPIPLRRQDKPVLYARNGPAVLAVRTAQLERGALYGDHTRAVVMQPEDSLDIDSAWDFELLEFILSRRTSPSRIHE